MIDDDSLLGQLLVAIPNTAHSGYIRGVMLVTAYWPDGAATTLINRPLRNGYTVGHIMQNSGIDHRCPDPIYYGGPDEPGRIQFVHTLDWQCPGTKPLNNYLGVTAEMYILSAIPADTGPSHWRCIAGHRYLNNLPGHPPTLHGELSGLPPWVPEHRWLTLPGTIESVFHNTGDDQWMNCITEAGKLKVSSWF